MSRAKRIAVRRWEQPDLGKTDSDSVAVEEPLEIRIRGRSITVTMRTPGHDAELATGFLLAESVISSRSDITEIAPCQEGESALHGNVLNVFLAPNVSVELERFSRHVFSINSFAFEISSRSARPVEIRMGLSVLPRAFRKW